jgi:hypothetical protein
MTDEDKLIREAVANIDKAIARMEGRLAQWKTNRANLLATITEEPSPYEGGLADACRTVLKSYRGSLEPTQVRKGVTALGYDMAQHDNQMAAIHGVLKRLVDQKEVKTKTWTKHPGVTRYFWADESIWTSAHDLSPAEAAIRDLFGDPPTKTDKK